MDQNQPAPSVVYVPVQQSNVFSTKIPSATTFAVAVLLFFLPFAELKCTPKKSRSETKEMGFDFGASVGMLHNTGLRLAMGKQWQMKGLGSLFNDGTDKVTSQVPPKPNMYAIAALALAGIGLIISLIGSGSLNFIGILSGVLGAGALIGLMVDLKSEINKQGSMLGKEGDDYTLSLGFTPWFYICIAALLAGAFFCYKRMQLTKVKLPPPY